MLVKYVGHGDMMSADWNGKRYIFSKRRPIVEIPDGLYDFIKSSNHIIKHDIVYCENVPVQNSEKIDIKPVVSEPAITEPTKKRGRPWGKRK